MSVTGFLMMEIKMYLSTKNLIIDLDFKVIILSFDCLLAQSFNWAVKNLSIDSLNYSSARKSLVKGERFMRMQKNQSEGH